jgi:DNA-binding NarL/FixJ family response regulator
MTTSSTDRRASGPNCFHRDGPIARSDGIALGPAGARVTVLGRRALIAAAIASTLRRGGHEVTSVISAAGHAADDLEAVVRSAPEVLVVDIDSRGGDMLEAIRSMRAAGQEMPVLVLTPRPGVPARRHLTTAGANAALARNTPRDALLRAVDLLHQGESVPMDAQSPELPPSPVGLTAREREVLEALAWGDGTTQIAARLGVRPVSARTYVQRVLWKLGVHSRSAAVASAVRLGVVDPGHFLPAPARDATPPADSSAIADLPAGAAVAAIPASPGAEATTCPPRSA